MGTDIHLQAERWNGERWERIPHPEMPCTHCADYDHETDTYGEPRGYFHPWRDAHEVGDHAVIATSNGRFQTDERHPCWSCKGTKVVREQWWHDRNYNVFAILADVRNGTGFAGVRTSAGFAVIAEPRGVPADVSDEVRQRIEETGNRIVSGRIEWAGREDDDSLYERFEATPEGWWDLGEHTPSWLTLAEIMDFDWSQTTTLEGWVDPWNFQVWREKGEPDGWSGSVSGSSVEHVSNRAMADLIDSGEIEFEDEVDPFHGRRYTTRFQRRMQEMGTFPAGSTGETLQTQATSYYTLVEWPRVYRDSAQRFLEAMGRLAEHAPDGDLSRVRIVFGFDS